MCVCVCVCVWNHVYPYIDIFQLVSYSWHFLICPLMPAKRFWSSGHDDFRVGFLKLTRRKGFSKIQKFMGGSKQGGRQVTLEQGFLSLRQWAKSNCPSWRKEHEGLRWGKPPWGWGPVCYTPRTKSRRNPENTQPRPGHHLELSATKQCGC